jgi:hypothetical protein
MGNYINKYSAWVASSFHNSVTYFIILQTAKTWQTEERLKW